MADETKDLGHGATAFLLLLGSYITLGFAVVSTINNFRDAFCSPSSVSTDSNMFLTGILYFVALLSWMLALYTAGLGRGKDRSKFLAAFTSYLAFIPVLVAFACYISGVSFFDIMEAISPPSSAPKISSSSLSCFK